MPAVFTVGSGRIELKFCGPVQTVLTFPGLSTACILMAGVRQVMAPPDNSICGAMVSAGTCMVASAEQPFRAVACRLYMPGIVTAGLGNVELKFCGPDQLTVLPGGATPEFRVIELVVQVSVPPDRVICGGSVSVFTKTVAVAVHPLLAIATTW